MRTRPGINQGFSLIEMAVVMLIMGSLLSGLLVALTQTSDNTRRTTAKNQLIKIEEALYAFARAHGRLPCPATSTSDGFESPNDGSGDCEDVNPGTTGIHGFVPAASLSLYGRINDDGLLLDPWANPYRYSVASYEYEDNAGDPDYGEFVKEGDGLPAFTTKEGLKFVFENNPSIDLEVEDTSGPEFVWQHMLRVCEAYDSCPDFDSDTYTSVAPAVVFSMANNWTNLIDDCGTAPASDEVENAGAVTDGDYCLTDTNTFVDTEYHEENFDDILVWLSPYILFSRMIDAAQLP